MTGSTCVICGAEHASCATAHLTLDDENSNDDGNDKFAMHQASRLLNVPAPTLRSWERRYGVPSVDRSSGGHRRYSRAQLDQLRGIRDLIAQGQRAVDAAALVSAGHSTSGPLIEDFVSATSSLTPDRIQTTLDAAYAIFGLDRTVDDVLLPAMREVGELWHQGRLDVAHEHLASTAARAWFAGLRLPDPPRQPPIILSCGPHDLHVLALEAIGALLRQRRRDCRLLGAQTPARSLASAVAETDAAAVVLVCHMSEGRRAAVESLRSDELRERHLFYAGGAFSSRRARQGVPGQYLGTNLGQASDLITATLTAPAR